MFHEFAPLIDPILNLIWLCCGIAKTTVTWAKIAHFAMVKKLVSVMDERIVAPLKWSKSGYSTVDQVSAHLSKY